MLSSGVQLPSGGKLPLTTKRLLGLLTRSRICLYTKLLHIWCLYRKYCLVNHLSLECMVSGSSNWKHIFCTVYFCIWILSRHLRMQIPAINILKGHMSVSQKASPLQCGNQEGPASIGARQNLWCAPGFYSGFGASASGFIFGFIWIPCRCIHARCIWVALQHTSSHGYWVGGVPIFSSKMSLDRCVSRLASQINVFRLIHWYIVSSLARLLVKVIWLWF